MKSIAPGLTRVAVLVDPAGVAASVIVPRILEAANSLALQTWLVEVASANEFVPAFASIRSWRAQALYVVSGIGPRRQQQLRCDRRAYAPGRLAIDHRGCAIRASGWLDVVFGPGRFGRAA